MRWREVGRTRCRCKRAGLGGSPAVSLRPPRGSPGRWPSSRRRCWRSRSCGSSRRRPRRGPSTPPSRPSPRVRPRSGPRRPPPGGRLGDRGPARRHQRRGRHPAPAQPGAREWGRACGRSGGSTPTDRASSTLPPRSAARGSSAVGPGFKVGEVTLVADGDIQRAYFHPMHRLANLRGSHAPARYVATFKFPSGAQLVELAIRLRHATGELSVSGLELRALELRPGSAGHPGPAGRLGHDPRRRLPAVLARGRSRAQRPGSGRGGRYGAAAVDDAGRYAGQHGDPPHRSAAATAAGRRCGWRWPDISLFSPSPACWCGSAGAARLGCRRWRC